MSPYHHLVSINGEGKLVMSGEGPGWRRTASGKHFLALKGVERVNSPCCEQQGWDTVDPDLRFNPVLKGALCSTPESDRSRFGGG